MKKIIKSDQDKQSLLLAGKFFYRKGQEDIVRRMLSIISGLIIGEEDLTIKELKFYLENYSENITIDQEIISELIG